MTDSEKSSAVPPDVEAGNKVTEYEPRKVASRHSSKWCFAIRKALLILIQRIHIRGATKRIKTTLAIGSSLREPTYQIIRRPFPHPTILQSQRES